MINNGKKAVAFILMGIIFLCVLAIYINSRYWSSFVDPDYPAFKFAHDFAAALRLNDSEAYNMTDPSLHPRIDEWLLSHSPRICTREFSEPFSGGGTMEEGYYISFSCQTSTGIYNMTIPDVFVKELETDFIITDWGYVEEDLP